MIPRACRALPVSDLSPRQRRIYRRRGSLAIALAAWRLGAGRAHAADPIDPAVGLTALVKSGEPVSAGAPLCMAHARSEKDLRAVMEQISTAFTIGPKPPATGRLIDELIE